MNKLFTKIATAMVGIAMAVGVGVAVGSNGAAREARADTKTGSWNLTTTSSDFSSSNCETYFSQPYGIKKNSAYIQSVGIADFGTQGTTQIKIGVKCLQNGGTGSRLTVYLQNSSGTTLASSVITPVNASSAGNTTFQYATFTSSLTGANKFKVQCTTFSKNILINGANYEVTYSGTPTPTTLSVAYDANGGTGDVPTGGSDYSSGDQITVKGNIGNTPLSKSGKIFSGWNTAADGSGTTYVAGDKFNISSNVTLYARWITDYSSSSSIDITGKYLNLPTSSNDGWTTEKRAVASDGMEYIISPSTSSFKVYAITSNPTSGTDYSYDKSQLSKVFMGKSGAYLYNKDPLQKSIDTVQLYAAAGCSQSVSVAIGLGTSIMDSSYTTGATTLSTQNHEYTFHSNQGSNNYRYFRVQVTNANNVNFQLRITYATQKHSITDSVTNGSLNNTTSVDNNAALNTTIVPTAGYDIPAANAVTVTMGGNTLTQGTQYTYNASTGAIYIEHVTGAVVVTATCPQIQTRAISTSLTNLNVKTGSATVLNVKSGATATVTLEVSDKHYTLPTTVSVTSNGNTLTAGSDYTYNSSTGAVVMTYNANYTGAIVITAAGVRKSYKAISVTVEHCSETTNIRSIDDGDTETLIFSASNGYELPSEITVTGTTVYTWTKSTGTLALTSQNSAISVTVNAIVHTLDNVTNLEPGKYYLNYINDGNHYFSGVNASNEGSSSSTIAGGAMAFTLSLVGDDSWTLVNDSGKYLGISGTGSTAFALGDTEYHFAITWANEQEGTRKFNSVEYSAKYIAWYATNTAFRTYASANAIGLTLERVESDISVDASSADKNVLKGTSFNATYAANAGFKAYIEYADGAHEEITSLATWTLDTSVVNNNATLTVTYSSQGNYSKTVTGMNVYTTSIDHLSVDASSSKLIYYLGATLDTTGVTIQGLDGEEAVIVSSISPSDCTFSPSTLNTVGSQTITVTYTNDDESEATGTYVVTVIQTINAVNKDVEREYSKSWTENADKWTSHSEAQTWNGVSWTPSITWDSTDPGIQNVDTSNNRGQQIGTKDKPARSVTLSTSGISGTITSVTVNAAAAADATASVSVKVNNVAYGGDAKSLTTSAADYAFEGNATGSVQIIISQPSTSKALYIKSIEIEYTSSVNIANAAGHEAAQAAVVRFAKAFNAAMDATNGCTTNMSTAWTNATKAYTNPSASTEAEKGFLQVISSLSSTEQDYAKDLIRYATVRWTDDTDENYEYCVERMVKTYKVCTSSKHNLPEFMSDIVAKGRGDVKPSILGSIENSSSAILISVLTVVGIASVAGYFFLRRRKEQ